MAIYMKYGSIKGSVTTEGFKDHIELDSFSFATSRNIGSAAGTSLSRESAEPTIGEIQITKRMDSASPKLFLESVAGQLDNKVKIIFTTTTKDKVTDYLIYELVDAGVSSYALQSGGGDDKPVESLSLNFTKVSETFKPLDPKISGQPETVGYDLKEMKKV